MVSSMNKSAVHRVKRRNCKAFTFVEMLLVISLLSVIAIAVFRAFVNGVKIWEKSYEARPEKDIMIFFDKLSQDLHNAMTYSLIRFEGKEHMVSFPAIVRTLQDPNLSGGQDIYINQIGRVEYDYDPLKNRIYRKQAGYGQALKDDFDNEQILADGILSLVFQYDYREEKGFQTRQIARETLPSYLQAAVTYGDIRNPRRIQKDIPVFIGD